MLAFPGPEVLKRWWIGSRPGCTWSMGSSGSCTGITARRRSPACSSRRCWAGRAPAIWTGNAGAQSRDVRAPVSKGASDEGAAPRRDGDHATSRRTLVAGAAVVKVFTDRASAPEVSVEKTGGLLEELHVESRLPGRAAAEAFLQGQIDFCTQPSMKCGLGSCRPIGRMRRAG